MRKHVPLSFKMMMRMKRGFPLKFGKENYAKITIVLIMCTQFLFGHLLSLPKLVFIHCEWAKDLSNNFLIPRITYVYLPK